MSPASRAIGRWALAGLMVNSIIGSGIFGVPGELVRLLGSASPFVCVLAGLAISVVIACFVEVGSQFTESGGPYLYVRTAFGRLAGIQIGWFTALTPIAAAAAQSTLFASYAASFYPSLGAGPARGSVIIGVVALPVMANLIGLRAGKSLSSVLVVAKLTPLLLLIGAGFWFAHLPNVHSVPIASHAAGVGVWLAAMLLAVFSFGGFEDALSATGGVTDPRRSVPFALIVSLLVCIFINTSIQWVTATAFEHNPVTSRPLATAAALYLGPWGATLIAACALISTSGAISVTVLAVPRLLAAMSERGELPRAFARMSDDGTPAIATLAVAAVIIALGISGTFRWALAVTAGSMTIFAGAVCAALPRLRSLQPGAATVHLPAGKVLAAVGVAISLLLLVQLQPTEAAPIGITVGVALLNWWIVRPAPRRAAMTPGFPQLPPLVPQVKSAWRRALGILGLRFARWRIVGNMPNAQKFVLIIAPHTSNWDFLVGALAYFALRLETVWLVKDTAVRGPWGALARHFGAAPIDRRHSHNVVQAYVDEFSKREKMVLTITPEGTRKKVSDWKRGFYHVAVGAKVSIVPVAFDFSSRCIVILPPFEPGADIEQDMAHLKTLYRKEMGRYPERFWGDD